MLERLQQRRHGAIAGRGHAQRARRGHHQLIVGARQRIDGERNRLGPLERDQLAERRFAHVVVRIARELFELVERRERAGGVCRIHPHLPHVCVT